MATLSTMSPMSTMSTAKTMRSMLIRWITILLLLPMLSMLILAPMLPISLMPPILLQLKNVPQTNHCSFGGVSFASGFSIGGPSKRFMHSTYPIHSTHSTHLKFRHVNHSHRGQHWPQHRPHRTRSKFRLFPLSLSSSNDNEPSPTNSNRHESNKLEELKVASVAGVSVSPLGFLVVLHATTTAANDEELEEITFPIQLTSSGASNPSNNAPSQMYSNSNNSTVQHDSNSNNSNSNNGTKPTLPTLPALFQENTDQTSVTTPEALTFLQLLNGVDMATPILPPDGLSSIVVWYSFLMEEMGETKMEERMRDLEKMEEIEGGRRELKELKGSFEGLTESKDEIGEGENKEVLQVEDELGLSNPTSPKATTNYSSENAFEPAMEYVRTMVRTTMPPMPSVPNARTNASTNAGNGNDTSNSASNASSTSNTGNHSYLNASPWQRARIQLPRVWLHGVRIESVQELQEWNDVEEMEDDARSPSGQWMESDETRETPETPERIGTIPLRFVLECSVDDKSKPLEIPLHSFPRDFAMALSQNGPNRQNGQNGPNRQNNGQNNGQNSESGQNTPMQSMPKGAFSLFSLESSVELSTEILQELSHNYNGATSASFLALSLFHRYRKSGKDGMDLTLRVSDGLLDQLRRLQDDCNGVSAKSAKSAESASIEDGDVGDGFVGGGGDGRVRYCWVLPRTSSVSGRTESNKGSKENDETRGSSTGGDSSGRSVDSVDSVDSADSVGSADAINVLIQSTTLPMYRPLDSLMEADQRVLQHLKQQNFGAGNAMDAMDAASPVSGNEDGLGGSSGSIVNPKTQSDPTPTPKPTPKQAMKALTMEQQAQKQRLKSAWKIAMEKGDEGALEKIQKAMEEFEKELMVEVPENDDVREGEEGELTALEKIQRAMKASENLSESGIADRGIPGSSERSESSASETNEMSERAEERGKILQEDDDEVVGLIAELEEATNSRLHEDDDLGNGDV